ncbi:hypothetical protein QJS10_CPA07g00640 [Acorus calamus]|uniref:Uncharacterized protein n=1 Tax=Acorus calamus TaxID=4465 RepID=A0AAV9EFJ5_ACOCL|nr:hypothetical protein QJS10_CPA07g00640 [Acorus calamus]
MDPAGKHIRGNPSSVFEEEKLVSRDHRRESAKGGKTYNAAIAAAGDGQQVTKEGEEKTKMHTRSYCCLDYSQSDAHDESGVL